MQITKKQAHELRELLEDAVAYFCDKKMVSGETGWTVVECCAQAKIAQLQGVCK